MCENDRLKRNRLREITIRLSCLSVDKAMIFLKSLSTQAFKPAKNMVKSPIIRIRLFGRAEFVKIFSAKKIPAVTRVEEWTKADTGVGAAIALGSQSIKGNCALFESIRITNADLTR